MAKDISNDDDDKFEKMDEESLGFLEQVRKGKSRNFVLSMKGNKVRSMIVKKKPIKEKDRKAAKGGGYQPVYGVATGMGSNITFSVARSDGFDEKAADCKTEKLKKFLNEQTGKMFKPTFELVDTALAIAFDEEDMSDPLIAKFTKLEPVIAKACDTHPDRIAEIQQLVNEIRELLQDDETRQSAGPKTDTFIQFLKELMSGGAAASTSTSGETPAEPAPVAPQADSSAVAVKLAGALKKLKPLMDEAIAADPIRQRELQATMVQIVSEIKSEQFDQATQNVMDFATLLKTLASQRSTAQSEEFSRRRTALEPRLLQAQRADHEKATKLGAVWTYADEQAEKNNFVNANTALERLEKAVADVLKQGGGSDAARRGVPEGIVAERRQQLEQYFRNRVRQTATETSKGVADVRSAIAKLLPRMNANALEKQINNAFSHVIRDVETTLTSAMVNESPSEIEAAIEALRSRIAANALIRHFQTAKRDLNVDPQLDRKFERMFADVLEQVKSNAA